MENETTEFCWSCRRRDVPKDEIEVNAGTFTSGICKDCQTILFDKLKASDAILIQKDRPPQYSAWHNKDVIIRDVSVLKDGQTFFIRGFHKCEWSYETSEVFNLVKQFVDTGFKRMRFYGDLEMLKTHDFWFYVQKSEQFYRIGGNCFDISNAFSFKTLDVSEIFAFIETWTVIPQSLKQHIISELDKGLVFASHPESFVREKLFCFKDYSEKNRIGECREPKVMVLKNFAT